MMGMGNEQEEWQLTAELIHSRLRPVQRAQFRLDRWTLLEQSQVGELVTPLYADSSRPDDERIHENVGDYHGFVFKEGDAYVAQDLSSEHYVETFKNLEVAAMFASRAIEDPEIAHELDDKGPASWLATIYGTHREYGSVDADWEMISTNLQRFMFSDVLGATATQALNQQTTVADAPQARTTPPAQSRSNEKRK